MEQLDAILTSTENDAEFEEMWARMMATTPPAAPLFPEPRPKDQARLEPRKTRVRVIRAAPPSLVKPGHSDQLLTSRAPQNMVPAPRKTPVVGGRVQRSSASTARKWEGLLAMPPPPPRQPAKPMSRRVKEKLSKLFGDISDLDEPDTASRAAASNQGKPATTVPRSGPRVTSVVTIPAAPAAIKGDRPSTASNEHGAIPRPRPAPMITANKPAPPNPSAKATPPTPTLHQRRTDEATVALAPPTTATVTPDATTPAPTTSSTPTAAMATRAVTPSAPRDRATPIIKVRVRGDLELEVPRHCVYVTRVYKARIGSQRFTLRFDRTGRCSYIREFPA